MSADTVSDFHFKVTFRIAIQTQSLSFLLLVLFNSVYLQSCVSFLNNEVRYVV